MTTGKDTRRNSQKDSKSNGGYSTKRDEIMQ